MSISIEPNPNMRIGISSSNSIITGSVIIKQEPREMRWLGTTLQQKWVIDDYTKGIRTEEWRNVPIVSADKG